MIRSFSRIDSPLVPAVALAAMLASGIWVDQHSELAYWALTLVMFGVLLLWQRSLRSKYARLIEVEHESSDIAPPQPYPLSYAILLLCLALLVVSVVYLELGPPYLITTLAACFIRRDLWLTLVIHHRKKLGEAISASI